MKKRVVITGIGAITPVGNTVDALDLSLSLMLQHISVSL